MNIRILLATVFVFAVPQSVHCQRIDTSLDEDDEEDDTSPDEEDEQDDDHSPDEEDEEDDTSPDEEKKQDDTSTDEEWADEGQLRSLHGLIDADRDGKVSLSETLTFARTVEGGLRDASGILKEIDTSNDGKLSLEELTVEIKSQFDGRDEAEQEEVDHRIELETAKFKAADANGDQLLDLEEVTWHFFPETHDGVLSVTLQDIMRQKDKNADGKLTPEEFIGADPSIGGDGTLPKDMLMDAHPSIGEDGTLHEEELMDFKMLDTNGDGALELSELAPWESGHFNTEKAMKNMFEAADKDGDMHVTADELANARDDLSTNDAHMHLVSWMAHHEL